MNKTEIIEMLKMIKGCAVGADYFIPGHPHCTVLEDMGIDSLHFVVDSAINYIYGCESAEDDFFKLLLDGIKKDMQEIRKHQEEVDRR